MLALLRVFVAFVVRIFRGTDKISAVSFVRRPANVDKELTDAAIKFAQGGIAPRLFISATSGRRSKHIRIPALDAVPRRRRRQKAARIARFVTRQMELAR